MRSATYTYKAKQIPTLILNRKTFEMRSIFALLILTNLGLLLGNTPATNLMFQPIAVATGEWWRILSWPFVHVSRYHLLLDATAFLLLYAGLNETKSGRRIGYLMATFCGSLLLPFLASPQIEQIGLCGLSGPAHGLLAISALELRNTGNGKNTGNLLLTGLLLKTGWELLTGNTFLQQVHLGDIGQPIVTTHAGGVIGGTLCFLFYTIGDKNHVPPSSSAGARGFKNKPF